MRLELLELLDDLLELLELLDLLDEDWLRCGADERDGALDRVAD